MLEFDLPKAVQSIIKVIGVGGGGSNAVNHMFTQGIVGVDFAVCNTDNQALASSPIPTKIQLGPGLTEGRGAGSRPEVGKHACLESIEDVQVFLSQHTKMLFITAGMGGGTGTGAAPIIAKAAKDMGILTVAIVTLPFTFEGKLRHRYAQEGLEELKKNVDSIIIISNDKLREIHGNLTFSEAFAQADNILTTAAKGIAEIITITGYVNVDFEDVNTVMRDSGVAIMGSAQAEGEDRARRAVDMALNSPLLEENNISGAQNVLLNITSGVRETTMDEISEITQFIQQEVGLDTNIIWGNCFDEELGDKLSVTVIASGFERHSRPLDQKPARTTVSLDDEKDVFSNKYSVEDFTSHENETTRRNIQDTTERFIQSYTSDPYMEESNEDAQKRSREREQVKAELRRNASRVKLNNTHTIIELENTPAYVRRRVMLEEIPHSSERSYSHFTINSDDELVLRNESPFLRDLAD
ncbi:MAG: cell division protein FtsZ [Saprospiraceae bacterium]|nr:cell division protein FtsZ [Saprospiraceae bacterium]